MSHETILRIEEDYTLTLSRLSVTDRMRIESYVNMLKTLLAERKDMMERASAALQENVRS